MARLLETDQTSVLQLLEEGRLDARLLAVLQRKGVSATPTVKNSVSRSVSQLKPESTEGMTLQQQNG